MSSTEKKLPISYSCHFQQFREGEQFVQVHSLTMVISGKMMLDDGERKMEFSAGQFFSSRKNHLLKFVKYPDALHGEFKSLSIYFDEKTLQDFSREYGYTSDGKVETTAFVSLNPIPSLAAFMQSLLAYERTLNEEDTLNILPLKQKEVLLLLLKQDPSLKDVLFDFSEPGKIDLEAFMEKNFHFNVQLERFAYLTGRSLSTFKRDFEKIYSETPSRWLLKRRLKEAHYLIKEKGKTATEVYLDLGFEDLSHFSYTFKKQFGITPSRLSA